jgi:hypothetical protein
MTLFAALVQDDVRLQKLAPDSQPPDPSAPKDPFSRPMLQRQRCVENRCLLMFVDISGW